MSEAGLYTVTFICTANMVRSVIAEAILNKRLEELAVGNMLVESAGTMRMYGMRAAENTIKVCAKHGIDVSSHRSRQLDAGVLYMSDLVLTAAKEHADYIKSMHPQFAGKVHTLKGYLSGAETGSEDIYDPYGDSEEVFERIYGIIETEIERILPKLTEDAGVIGGEG